MAEPVLPVGRSLAGVEAEILAPIQVFPHRRGWWIALAVSLLLLGVFLLSSGLLLARGPGIWGVNQPVYWGIAIMNYVWWVGIGNAGTLISAALLLTGQVWRNALNRFAEAMTLFAMVCAGLYPILHLGRPWLFYWMFPYPNSMDVWPQFRSPLCWDVFAILIYLIVSLLFWYTGLLPDLASLRDRASGGERGGRWRRIAYGLPALGWRGSARHWHDWRQAYRFLAALAVPLVVSVHSEVAMLFAASALPGWHSTLFPPFFVIGAAYSGFGVVAVLAVALRRVLGLEDVMTPRHLDILAQILAGTALLMGLCYGWEVLDAFRSGALWDLRLVRDRLGGAYAWSFWLTIALNVALPQLLWLPAWRRSRAVLPVLAAGVVIGMWLERYMLVVTSLTHSFLPSSWGGYVPTLWDWAVFAGTGGVFLFPFLLFVRFVPAVSATEIKEAMAEEGLVPAALSSVPSAETPARGEIAPAFLLAEFGDPPALLAAVRELRRGNRRPMDAFTPFPVEGLAEALGQTDRRLERLGFLGLGLGGLLGWWVQWQANADYPLNIGGRPLQAPPAFTVLTFEFAVLGAALFLFFGLLRLARLPRLHHPLFDVPRFTLASRDRYFLLVDAPDRASREAVAALGPLRVEEIAPW